MLGSFYSSAGSEDVAGRQAGRKAGWPAGRQAGRKAGGQVGKQEGRRAGSKAVEDREDE